METNLPPQPNTSQRLNRKPVQDIGTSSTVNRYTRPQWLSNFLLGHHGIRRTAQMNGIGEAVLEQEIREQLILGGALERVRRPRRAS